MNGDHMHGMAPSPSANGTAWMFRRRKMMMHMTFFWGTNAEILFTGWPGPDSVGIYALALVFIFVLSVLVEWLAYSNLVKDVSNRVAAGMVQTTVYTIRVGLSYMVMLAVMSFNAGVFLAAIAGHALGFFFFGSRAFKKTTPDSGKTSDVPRMSC